MFMIIIKDLIDIMQNQLECNYNKKYKIVNFKIN